MVIVQCTLCIVPYGPELMVCLVSKSVYILIVQGVYGVILHYLYYCTTGCSFYCLSMLLIIYTTALYSAHTTGCPFYCLSMLLIIYITAPYSAHITGCPFSIKCWLKKMIFSNSVK